MSGVFDRLRSGAGKAALEADKIRRVTGVQSVIRSLKEEVDQAFHQAGYVASDLHRSGRITQPELLEACERIAALQAQIVAREREIESIRAETYVEPTPLPSSGHMCPNGHGDLPPGARFCPVCGAQGVPIASPATGASCLACGAALIPEARFCPKCGAPAPEPSPPSSLGQTRQVVEESPLAPPPPPAGVSCPTCGTDLVPGARFCPDCGTAVPGQLSSPPIEGGPQAVRASPVAPPTPSPFSAPTSALPPAAPPAVTATLCPQCEASLVPGGVFCPECGHPVVQSADTAPEVAMPEESTPPPISEPSAVDSDESADEWES